MVVKDQRIPLSKGKKLPLDFHKEATVGTSQDDYAQVAYDEKKDGMVLINDSKDTWIVINTGKKIGAQRGSQARRGASQHCLCTKA